MKRINAFLIIAMMLCSMLILPGFTLNVDAITQHETSDGTTYGKLITTVEKYTSGDDSYYTIYCDPTWSYWSTQTFTIGTTGTNENHTITNVTLKLFRVGSPGTVTVGIRAVDGAGKPTGNDLTNGTTNGTTLTTVTAGEWREIALTPYELSVSTKYSIVVRLTAGDSSNCIKWRMDSSSPTYTGGSEGYSTDSGATWTLETSRDFMFEIYSDMEFNITRDIGLTGEINNCSFTPIYNFSDDVTVKIPVSTDTRGIINVTNNTCGNLATEVNTSDDLVNNTFWYDSTNQFVHIRTINLTTSSIVNWTVNCSYGATFSLQIPQYLNVGDYFMAMGLIKDSDGTPISGMIAKTRILSGGTDAITPVEWNCTNGNYYCTFSTNLLVPGTYDVSIEFTDPSLGIVFKEGSILYLSTTPGSGIYVSSFLHFAFYNNNTGLGLNSELFKIYASEDITIDSTDRIYVDMYNTYTGQTIYYRVDDYFDNQIYPTTGSYKTLAITDIEQFEDIPIDWYSFSVKNMNHSIVRFKMTNGSRTYSQYLYPYEPFYWDVLNGTYTINLTYYNPETDAIVDYHEENITITDDTYYWIRGYDLQDIILEIQITNSSLDALIISVTANVNITDSSINTITTNIVSNLTLTETNLTTLINSYSSNFTIIDSIVDHINNTIWSNISFINSTLNTMNNTLTINIGLLNSTVDYINTTIWSEITAVNSSIGGVNTVIITMWADQNISLDSLTNRSVVAFNFYNTNEGLGLDRETLKIYINGSRLVGNTYHCYNESDKINVTIKDYYNTTLYHNNFTITAPFTFIDLGLTFHSWLFGNKNDDYYMISLRKEGATRWWERGIVPYGEREFSIPSGNYSMRLYNNTDDEIYNTSDHGGNITINNSRVYIIHGTNLTEIISGQSVIRGQLLELQSELDYALTPNLVIVSCNPPMIFSVFDKEGMAIGNGIYKICPALIVIATTRTEYTGNWINSSVVIPSNGTVENGTITILEDTLYISGNGSTSYINITYANNGTLIQNTTYIPGKINLYGQNITINASNDIHILRETQYNQEKKFYWTYYSNTGRHTAGIDVINPMATPLYDVYVYVEFSNESTPDPTTVVLRDIANDGVVLKQGVSYDVTSSGIHFYLLSINASYIRGFTIEYYKQITVETYNYGEAKVGIPMYEETMWNDDESYNMFIVNWRNAENTVFRGGLYVKLNFLDKIPDGMEINVDSIRVWDDDKNIEIDESCFVFGTDFIRVGTCGVGDVAPGGGRTFKVYFLLTETFGVDPSEVHLNTAIVKFHGFPVTPFFIIFLLGAILIGYGVYEHTYKKIPSKRWKSEVGLGVFVIFVFYILATMGV